VLDQIIVIYCICDEVTKVLGIRDDIQGLRDMSLHLPQNSILLADRAYTDYQFEDDLFRPEHIRLLAKRKHNSRRQHSDQDEGILKVYRNKSKNDFFTTRSLRSLESTELTEKN
jgi:hypothetical protein